MGRFLWRDSGAIWRPGALAEAGSWYWYGRLRDLSVVGTMTCVASFVGSLFEGRYGAWSMIGRWGIRTSGGIISEW